MSNGLFGGGNGTESSPYLVEDAADLDAVRTHLNAHFKQTKNIDLATFGDWTPVGGDSGSYFGGSFDGSDFTIANLTINSPGRNRCGLFGEAWAWSGSKSWVQFTNIHLENCSVIGGNEVGGLIGYASRCEVKNCTVEGTVSGDGEVGGLIGVLDHSNAERCHASSTVRAGFDAGGLIGSLFYSNAKRCSSKSIVTGSRHLGGLIATQSGDSLLEESYAICDVLSSPLLETSNGWRGEVGGLVGLVTIVHDPLRRESRIINCYAQGSVRIEGHTTSGNYIGGLLGRLEAYPDNSNPYVTVSNCYSTVKVKVDNYGPIPTVSGGLSGHVRFQSTLAPSSSYYDIQTSGQSDTDKGMPKTTAEMKQKDTFSGWDFGTTWKIEEGKTYPTFIFLTSKESTQCTAFPLFKRLARIK